MLNSAWASVWALFPIVWHVSAICHRKEQSGASKCFSCSIPLPLLSITTSFWLYGWPCGELGGRLWLSIQKSGMQADQQNLSVNQAFLRREPRGMPLLLVVLTVLFSKYAAVATTAPCSCAQPHLHLVPSESFQIYLLSVTVRRLGLLCKLIFLDLEIQKASFAWSGAHSSFHSQVSSPQLELV